VRKHFEHQLRQTRW